MLSHVMGLYDLTCEYMFQNTCVYVPNYMCIWDIYFEKSISREMTCVYACLQSTRIYVSRERWLMSMYFNIADSCLCMSTDDSRLCISRKMTRVYARLQMTRIYIFQVMTGVYVFLVSIKITRVSCRLFASRSRVYDSSHWHSSLYSHWHSLSSSSLSLSSLTMTRSLESLSSRERQWRERQWRKRQWRERSWRERQWRERQCIHMYTYVLQCVAVYICTWRQYEYHILYTYVYICIQRQYEYHIYIYVRNTWRQDMANVFTHVHICIYDTYVYGRYGIHSVPFNVP